MKQNKNVYTIHIDLDGKDDLYDEYNWNILNDKLANYINKQVSKSHLEDKIIIEIRSGFTLSKEKEKMANCIKEYYNAVLTESNVYERVSTTKNILLLLLGILFLLIANNFLIVSIFRELLNIAGWVAIWEVVYNVLFTENERKFKKKRNKKIINSDIKFK